MRVPLRRGEKRPEPKDPYLTAQKYQELAAKLDRLRSSRPRLAEEVKRLAEMGDFSENAGYQLAKGRLRGLNQRIMDLESQLKVAVIIQADKGTGKVQIGSLVTVRHEGKEKEYTILGSTESDPGKGVISHLSPLGAALMGRKEGETARFLIKDNEQEFMIIKIREAEI